MRVSPLTRATSAAPISSRSCTATIIPFVITIGIVLVPGNDFSRELHSQTLKYSSQQRRAAAMHAHDQCRGGRTQQKKQYGKTLTRMFIGFPPPQTTRFAMETFTSASFSLSRHPERGKHRTAETFGATSGRTSTSLQGGELLQPAFPAAPELVCNSLGRRQVESVWVTTPYYYSFRVPSH